MEQNVAGLTVFEQAWAWFEANKKQIAWGACILVVVGLIVSYYVWSQGEKELLAGDSLSDAVAATLSGGNRTESADAYLKVATAHPRTSAGARALLAAAGALFTQGKYAEAQAQFQKFNRDYPDSPFRSQAMLGMAASLDALAKPEEAARAYKELIDRHPGEIVVPQAKLALARIYESQNKLNEARSLYEDIARAQGYSSIGNEAGIKAEELRSKQPATLSAPAAAPAFPILSKESTPKTNKP
jgi:TolA-binding protein